MALRLSFSAFVLALCMLVAQEQVVASPAWQYAASRTATGEDWRAVDEPWAPAPPDAPDGWFRTALPGDAHRDLVLYVGFMFRPFEVYCGDELIYHFVAPRASAPQTWLDLGTCKARTLTLRTFDIQREHAGIWVPVVVGPRQVVAAKVFAATAWRTVVGIILVALGLASLFAAFTGSATSRTPYPQVAAMFIVNGVHTFARTPLGGLALGNGALAFLVLTVAAQSYPVFEILYYRLIFRGRAARATLAGFAFVFLFLFVAIMGCIAIGSSSWYDVLLVGERVQWCFFAALLVICVGRFRAQPIVVRVAFAGFIISAVVSLYELTFAILVRDPPIPLHDIGVVGWTLFLALSIVVMAREARAQHEQQKLAAARAHAVAQTTQMLAHDVRKPFSLMRVLLDMLTDVKTVEEMKTTVIEVREEVLGATQSVDAMIQDVMEMGSSAPPVTARVEVAELLRTTLRHFFLRPTRVYDVRLTYQLRHRHRLEVHRAKVERVLLNIVGNALEAMHGRGELWFETREVERKGGTFIELTVGNSNSFIPPESIKKLFDPFFTSGKVNGTGLGLAIAQKVITAHGGDIECRSSRETGVEFVFTLPAAPELATADGVGLPGTAEEMAALARPQPPAEAKLGAPAAPVVVLVEDSGAHRAAWLARLPPGALRAYETPEAFLAAVNAEPGLVTEPKFLVLDQHFPHGSMLGTELADRLRPKTAARILLCSSQAVGDLSASVDGVLPKRPHDLAELAAFAEHRSATPDTPAPRGHVVLVEDSRAVQRAWRKRMPDDALRVFDAPEALLAELEGHPSVLAAAQCIVLDQHFAGEMRGEDLAMQLRERRLTDAPVLLSSDEDLGILPPGIHARIPKRALCLEELADVLGAIRAAST